MDTRERADRREAQAAFDGGDLTTAAAACKRLLKRDKKDENVLQMMAEISRAAGLNEEALSYYEKCLKHHPHSAQAHFNTANLLLAMGNTEGALSKLNTALKLRPGFHAARIEKAFVYERIGRYEDALNAVADLQVTGQLVSLLGRIQCQIAVHRGRFEEGIRIADEFVHDESVPPTTRRQIALLRGEAYEKLKNEEKAFESWQLAHSIGCPPFDPSAYERQIDEVMDFFSGERLQQLPRASNTSELPVFIAGMPRSGTTLIEQIIDAHPAALGAGELTEVDVIHRSLHLHLRSSALYPHCLNDLSTEKADRLAALYLTTLNKLKKHAHLRVVNKSLENYKLLGMIALLLPRARVIYCRRNPVDACLSVYMSDMLPSRHPYAADLGHIGFVYRQCERLMEHWQKVLDLPILEVRYEDLIADQETVSRRIIDFCGLTWDEKCLRFHESGRAVMTLSYHQVSKPVYTSAIGRYKRYEQYLGPLLDALQSEV